MSVTFKEIGYQSNSSRIINILLIFLRFLLSDEMQLKIPMVTIKGLKELKLVFTLLGGEMQQCCKYPLAITILINPQNQLISVLSHDRQVQQMR